jgi:hypothetical protein
MNCPVLGTPMSLRRRGSSVAEPRAALPKGRSQTQGTPARFAPTATQLPRIRWSATDARVYEFATCGKWPPTDRLALSAAMSLTRSGIGAFSTRTAALA